MQVPVFIIELSELLLHFVANLLALRVFALHLKSICGITGLDVGAEHNVLIVFESVDLLQCDIEDSYAV